MNIYKDNRELSWLKFNDRVLMQAKDESVPLGERLTFISIFQTNLDEFFRVRMGFLFDQALFYPALKENRIVLCDRYVDSSLAYQGGGKNLGVNEVLNINLFATNNTLPDLTLLFDIEPDLGLKRIADNSNREVNRLDLEKIEFYNKVRATFLDLAKTYKNRYKVIDASLPLEEVYNITYKIIKDKLNENR